jgi:hypothetical protein
MSAINLKAACGIALGATLSVAMNVQAAPFFPNPGPIFFQFTNQEQVDIGVNAVTGVPSNSTSTCGGCSGDPEGNWGIAQVSILREGVFDGGSTFGSLNNDINSAGTVPQYADQLAPTPGNQVTAMFYGVTQTSISQSGSVVSLASTGGFIDLYYDEPGLVGGGTIVNIGTELPGGRTADDQFTGVTDGIFLGRLAFASGIDPSDATTFVQGTIDTALANNSGSADSYANVVDVNGDGVIDSLDGLWAATLDSDVFGTAFGTRDLRFSNKIDLDTNWDGSIAGCLEPGSGDPCVLGLASNDPGRAYAVPEPGTVALLGIALAGFGMGAKRRRRAS